MSGNLFCQDGDEYLDDDIATVWERIYDDLPEPADHEPDDPAQWEIQEWTSTPLGDFLPSTSRVLERMEEDLYDEVTEYANGAIESAFAKSEVIAAFDYARALLARHLARFAMADKMIATHIITLDEHDQPLVNGEPMYITKEAGSA